MWNYTIDIIKISPYIENESNCKERKGEEERKKEKKLQNLNRNLEISRNRKKSKFRTSKSRNFAELEGNFPLLY